MGDNLRRRLKALERNPPPRETRSEFEAFYREAGLRHDAALSEGREPTIGEKAAAEWLRHARRLPKASTDDMLREMSDEGLDGLEVLIREALDIPADMSNEDLTRTLRESIEADERAGVRG